MPEIAGTSVAIAVVVISILISGIAIGLGRAFGYKKIERFGLEELAQAILNAALVGAIVGIVGVLSGVTASFTTSLCADGNAINELQCSLTAHLDSVSSLYQETLHASQIVSYYQSMALDFGTLSIQPFRYLDGALGILSNQAMQLQFLLLLGYLQLSLVAFLRDNAFVLLLSAGLVFRAFFATRKLGAFLIALFLGTYLFYPLFALVFPFPAERTNEAVGQLESFNANSLYATQPLVDLNDNFALAQKLDAMSTHGTISLPLNGTTANVSADVTGDLATITEAGARALGNLWFSLVAGPLLALLVVGVLVKELSGVLSSEIGFSLEAI